MKKKSLLVALFLSLFIFVSCSDDTQKTDENKTAQGTESCSEKFNVSTWSGQSLNLKAKVVSYNLKNIVSSNGGTVEYLDCEKWKKVTEKTLIAKIKPDPTDPVVQNLVNQSSMIHSQIANIRDIIISTKSNFDTQLNSLSIQKANIESQLKILDDSYKMIGEQKDFWVLDIDKQIETLNIQLDTLGTQISDLNKSKTKLEDSKKADLAKLDLNLKNTKVQTKSLIGNALLQIDETFWITEKNKSKSEGYRQYLSAKDTSLKNDVEHDWTDLNTRFQNFDTLSNDNISDYLQSLNDLVGKAKNSIKNSVSSATFPQTTIDSFYNVFIQYESNIVNTKNGLDNIIKSMDTVTNTYDTQILGLSTQINGAENSKRSVASSMDNIKSNKLGTYTTSVDLQKNQTTSQIETAKTNLSNIASQMDSLRSQENIQLNQLNSQLSQLQSSLNTIDINLSGQSFYAETVGTVKEKSASLGNKVWSNSMLCQILPEKSSLKIQVYSSYDLPLPTNIKLQSDGKEYTAKIITKMPYQASVTQNYIYETEDFVTIAEKVVGLADVFSEWKTMDVSTVGEKNVESANRIFIPINFVSNTINGSKLKVQNSSWGVSEKQVILGELDANNIEVRSWLNFGDTICK